MMRSQKNVCLANALTLLYIFYSDARLQQAPERHIMEESKTYENFPLWMPALASLITVSIYITGAMILAGFGIAISILYLLFCVGLEIRIMRRSCVNCYYYGKVCGIGKGRLAALLFKQGDAKKFAQDVISWTDLLPDFMVFLVPALGAAILMVRHFAWSIATLLVVLIVLAFGGNGAVRSSFACKYCKQRELGCPAEKLFRNHAS